MKVKAIKRGFYGSLREKGEVFDYDGPTAIPRDGKKVDYFPSWMQRLEEPRKPGRPSAKSEETKQV